MSGKDFIIVLSDEKMKKLNAQVLRDESSAHDKDVFYYLKESLMFSPGYLVGKALVDGVVFLSRRLSEKEVGLPISYIGRSEANGFKFPPGHPREGIVYAAHPTLDPVYFPVSAFHRLTFEHKFSEAINLLMSLGAAELKVEHTRGWSRDFAAKLSVNEFSAESALKTAVSESLLYEAHFSKPQSPKVPDGLVWYNFEPTWQSLADGRIKFGLKQFSLTINYDDDFGINSNFKLKASELGLDLGGSFEEHKATTWVIRGRFFECP